MLDDDLSVALGLGGGVTFSNNVALSLSKKVTEVQREIARQLRTEVVDHARAETAEKEPDKGQAPEKNSDRKQLSVQPDGHTQESISSQKQQVNITV